MCTDVKVYRVAGFEHEPKKEVRRKRFCTVSHVREDGNMDERHFRCPLGQQAGALVLRIYAQAKQSTDTQTTRRIAYGVWAAAPVGNGSRKRVQTLHCIQYRPNRLMFWISWFSLAVLFQTTSAHALLLLFTPRNCLR